MKTIYNFLFRPKQLRDKYPHATRGDMVKFWFYKWTRRISLAVLLIGFLGSFGYAAYFAGSELNPKLVQGAEKIIEVPSTSIPPVLQRIMKCESENRHKNLKNGQITYHVNSNGTIDLGVMEINTTHFAEASRLNYDLTKEADNIAFGQFLYAQYGTEPWYSSKACWLK